MIKEINTSLMEASYKSFKTSFKRSILGVTYSTHKRKKDTFYQHKIHNEQITDLTIEKMWSDVIRVQKQLLDSPENLRLKASYKIEWDKEGKIINFHNVNINILESYGDLLIPKITMESRTEPVHLYLFTSEYDFSSKEIKNYLIELMKEYEEEISFNEVSLSSEDGKDKAEMFKVTGTPTIWFDEIKLENPDKKDIKNLLEKIKLSKIISEPSTFVKPEKETLTVDAYSH